jgi:hypothetical protein
MRDLACMVAPLHDTHEPIINCQQGLVQPQLTGPARLGSHFISYKPHVNAALPVGLPEVWAAGWSSWCKTPLTGEAHGGVEAVGAVLPLTVPDAGRRQHARLPCIARLLVRLQIMQVSDGMAAPLHDLWTRRADTQCVPRSAYCLDPGFYVDMSVENNLNRTSWAESWRSSRPGGRGS